MTEVLPTAESDAGTQPRASSNIRHFCRMEIAGGGQIVIDGNYAYISHQHRPQGTTILDISDPRKPKVLSTLTPNNPWSHSEFRGHNTYLEKQPVLGRVRVRL